MKPAHILLAALALISLVVLGSGCTRNIPPPDNALQTPEELRAAIDERVAQIEDARFKEIVLDYFGDGERVKVRQLILVKQPDMLRVQTRLPGTDSIMSLLVTDGQTFAMHDRDTNQYFTGKPTPRNISLLLPVDLSAADVVRIMLGGAPWERFERTSAPATMHWDTASGRYLYQKPTPDGGTLRMWVRHTDFAVVEVSETDAGGRSTYEYTTKDWKRADKASKIALPDYRRFVWPARNLDFSVDVRDTQINPGLSEAQFQLAPPPGSTIVYIED